MLILNKLWNGELEPAGRTIRNPEYTQCLREVSRAGDALRAGFSPEEKQDFETYREKLMEMGSLLERDAFFTGFRMAGQLLLDILNGPEIQ